MYMYVLCIVQYVHIHVHVQCIYMYIQYIAQGVQHIGDIDINKQKILSGFYNNLYLHKIYYAPIYSHHNCFSIILAIKYSYHKLWQHEVEFTK